MELGRYGITANLYSPGVIKTAMWDSIDEAVTTAEQRPRGSQFAKMPQYITLCSEGTKPCVEPSL